MARNADSMVEVTEWQSELVCGMLHKPMNSFSAGLVLTHGAGANCGSALLVAVADAFAAAGVLVLRCDLLFRQQRRVGAPFPAQAKQDREGLKMALKCLRKLGAERLFLGGHSYGGRQASILVAEEVSVAEHLLLLSYPLHPPRKPLQLRTDHFPNLKVPATFVHGVRDPFGSIGEMENALRLIPAATKLMEVSGAGHELANGKFDVGQVIQSVFAPTG